MKFIAVMNKEIDLGLSLNALAHMSFGLGHRVDGEPNVHVFFGDQAQIRAFRQYGLEFQQQAILSDFPHTMAGADTPMQLAIGARTAEVDITYFGACLLVEDIAEDLSWILSTCSQLENYRPYLTEDIANLLPPPLDKRTDELTGRKMAMLINHKLPLAVTINATVLASLVVGKKVPYAEQRLLDVPDNDGGVHPNISFHPFVILTPAKPYNKKHFEIVQRAEGAHLATNVQKMDEEPLATVVFGHQAEVDLIIPKKDARLYALTLNEKFVAVESPQVEDIVHAIGSLSCGGR